MSRRHVIDLQVQLPYVTPMRTDVAAQSQQQMRVFGSDLLFDGTKEVGIEHGGALYRLKITRQGKLILNK